MIKGHRQFKVSFFATSQSENIGAVDVNEMEMKP